MQARDLRHPANPEGRAVQGSREIPHPVPEERYCCDSLGQVLNSKTLYFLHHKMWLIKPTTPISRKNSSEHILYAGK